MLTFKQFLAENQILAEKASPEITTIAAKIAKLVVDSFPGIKEMGKRGNKFSSTGVYQVRVAPEDVNDKLDVESTLDALRDVIKKSDLNAKNVTILGRAKNSGKFSSVHFKIGEMEYEVVLARGGNAGEQHEKEVVSELISLHKGDKVNSPKHAHDLLDALHKIDSRITLDNIKSIAPRTGKTQRANVTSPEEAGKIIADTIITLNDGTEIYLSLKDKRGRTIANFGISGVFDKSLSADTGSPHWKRFIAPMGFDVDKLEAGLKSYVSKKKLKFKPIVTDDLPKFSPRLKNMLKLLFGANYIYVRKTSSGFDARWVTSETIDNSFLKGMKIIQMRYPRENSKQASLTLINANKDKYILEIRNTSGGIVPNQLNFALSS